MTMAIDRFPFAPTPGDYLMNSVRLEEETSSRSTSSGSGGCNAKLIALDCSSTT